MKDIQLNQNEITYRYDAFAKYYNLAEFFMRLFIGRYRKSLLTGVKGRVLEVGIGTVQILNIIPMNALFMELI